MGGEMATTILRTSDGKLDSQDLESLANLEKRLEHGSRKLLLYLHGGLVDQKSAEEMATRLSAAGGLNPPDDWEQVYVIWRTGVAETLRANWLDLFENDRLYRALFKKLMPYISEKLGGLTPVGRGGAIVNPMTDDEVEAALQSRSDHPFADLEEKPSVPGIASSRAAALGNVSDDDVEMELGKRIELDPDLQKVCANIDTYIARKTLDVSRGNHVADAVQGEKTFSKVNTEIQSEWEDRDQVTGRPRALLIGGSLISVAKHGVRIAIRVISRMRKGRDHGVHATIAEEMVREFYGDLIGSIVWGMMVKDARDHFNPGSVGPRLISALSGVKDLQLLVVGHSAGSIWATEFLSARNAPGVPPADLVLLAPAIRIKRFADFLSSAPDAIRNFRMFIMSDKLERADVLLGKGYGFLYPSSLLYLVSGLFESEGEDGAFDAALLGMDRFVGQEPPKLSDQKEIAALEKVRAFLNAEPNRVILSESNAGAGLNCLSHAHGAFDDDPKTLASVATYLG
ncbi:hypothetical protein X733_25530 [Mesorhizobium sp. L2C067A000]|nr:hypothetical protein X733_25530 [Mesorhizobium sp. L2C067A000]